MADLRFALRFLWMHKGFTAAAVLTLAIGLGANTAYYGLIDFVLRPLPLPDADRIVVVAAEARGDDTGGFQYTFSSEHLTDFQERAEPFSAVMATMPRIGGLAHAGRASQFWFAVVSDNYFGALGVTPAAGELFTGPSGSPVHVVLGHGFWQKTFGGSRAAIGTSVRLDGVAAVISGVVAEPFRGTLMGVELDGYIALDDFGVISPDSRRWLYHNRRARPFELLGRLKPGLDVAEAQAAVDVLMETLEREHPDTDRGLSARVIPETRARPIPMRAVSEVIPLVRLFGLAIAGLVLLLACMNVANLLLVRATARQREIAVRAALGASRGRLARQMILEGLILSGAGGLAGIVVGHWIAAGYLSRLDLGADIPLRLDVTLSGRVFLFSLAAAALTGLLIGLWPAWRASRADARAALHDGGRGHSDSRDRQRLRRLLVVGQIAGALALLTVAGLFVRTLTAAERTDLGFDAGQLITVRLDPRQAGYDEDRVDGFYRNLQRRVAAWPDVASVAVGFSTPMGHLIGGGHIYVEGQPLAADTQPPASFINHVGHGYFATMGIPIVRGRPFTGDDERERTTSRKVVIVNEVMAERFWPGQDPIGKRLQVYSTEDPMLEVVGVARTSKYILVFEAPRPYLFLPMARDIALRTLHVRAVGDPAPLAPRLEREIRAMAPDVPIADLRTMAESLGGLFGYLIFRVGAVQASGMGLLGLLLAIVGVYGVVSFGAALRTREVGIRVAIGAAPRDVLRLILGQGVQLIVIGLAAGLAASVALSRVLAQFLPLLDPRDWLTFGTVAVALGALALTACYVPARRATRVPVMTALRHE